MYQSVSVGRAGAVAQAAAPPASERRVTISSALSRVFDLLIAILAIAFTAPLLLAVLAAVKAADRGPALFGHLRVGRDGRAFQCFKFRTMVLDADAKLARLLATDPAAWAEWAQSQKLRRDPRITPIGVFLRRSSLDELPQLFNVLRGDMSIVGPRPIVAEEVARYGHRFAWYCKVRPGITGYWQVSGRNDTTYRRRVAMDTLYAKNKSLAWDIKIVAQTAPVVLLAKGSY